MPRTCTGCYYKAPDAGMGMTTLLHHLIERCDSDITYHIQQQILQLEELAFIDVSNDSACRMLIGEDECWECESESPSELADTVLRLVAGRCRTPPSSSCSPPDTVASTPPTGSGA